MKKILFVLSSLKTGGAEKVCIDILKNLENKFDFSLCLFEKKGELIKDIPAKVKIFNLRKKSRWSFVRLIWKLQRIIQQEQPDVVVSFLWYSTFITEFSRKLILKKLNKKQYYVAYEPHNHLQDIRKTRFSWIKALLIKKVHKKMDLIVVDSYGVQKDISCNYGIGFEKLKVIYNPIDMQKVVVLSQKPVEKNIEAFLKEGKFIIAGFGRLIKRKGFNDLIRAFKKVRSSKNAKLLIVGEGEERAKLEKLIIDLELKEHVLLTGYLENPYSVISRCDIFCFSSLWEGFGNVIVEVMACGVPVIATRCPFGPDEIITDGVNGLLVPVKDENAMTEAIIKLIENPELRKKLADEGKKRAEDFRAEKIVAEYEKLFLSEVNNG